MSDMSKRKAEEILGLTESYTKSQLKSSYSKKAMQFHPDKARTNGMSEEKANSVMSEINQAFQYLSTFFKDDPNAIMTCSTSDDTYEYDDEPYDDEPYDDDEYGTSYDDSSYNGSEYDTYDTDEDYVYSGSGTDGNGTSNSSGNWSANNGMPDWDAMGGFGFPHVKPGWEKTSNGTSSTYDGANGGSYGTTAAYSGDRTSSSSSHDSGYASRKYHTSDFSRKITSNPIFKLATKRWIWGIIIFFMIEGSVISFVSGFASSGFGMMGSDEAIREFVSIISTPISGFLSYRLSILVRPVARMLASIVAFPIAFVMNVIHDSR